MNKLILLLLLALGVSQSQTPSTQVDYNRQIRNTPTSYTAIPGTNTLASAVTNTPTGGTLILPNGIYTISTSWNIAKTINIQCQPGVIIKAASNNTMVIITGNNVLMRDCILDGQFSQSAFTSDGVDLTSTSGVNLQNIVIRNIGGDGLVILNSTAFTVTNPNITSPSAPLTILTNPSAAGNTSGLISGGILTKTGNTDLEDVIVAFTEGASGLNQTINGLTIQNMVLNNGGTSWCIENNAITGSGTKIYSENVTFQNNHCYNTAGVAQRGLGSFAGSNHTRVLNNTYDGGGLSAGTLTVEFAPGDDQQFMGNTISHMANSAGINSIIKDGPGDGFIVANNHVVSSILLLSISTSITGETSITNPLIFGNEITMPAASGGAAIGIGTNGGSTNGITGATVCGNSMTGGSGATSAINLTNFGSGASLDSTIVCSNQSTVFTTGVASGSNQTNTVMAGNNWKSASSSCGSCVGIISATDVNQPWFTNSAFTAASVTAPTITQGSLRVLSIDPASGVNSDTAGALTIGGGGTAAYSWLNGPYTTAGPNCTVSYFNHAGTIIPYFGESTTVLTLHGDVGAIVTWICGAKLP